MTTSRDMTVDFLRGLAVLLMIFVHATAYFLDNTFVYWLWDYTHIVVPLFVFCSSFIVFSSNKTISLTIYTFLKRTKRIVFPYFYYVIVFLATSLILSGGSMPSLGLILKLLTLGTGRDLGWLVVLFLYITFLVPVIKWLFDRSKGMFFSFFIAGGISSLYFLFESTSLPFRYIMWLPWSFFIAWVILFAKNKESNYFLFLMGCITGLVFIISRFTLILQDASLVFTSNKYPPNIYYLSYGMMWTSFLFLIHKILVEKGLYLPHVQKIFHYLSFHSYSLFFIHFIFVKIFVDLKWHVTVGWWWFFILLLVLSIVVVEVKKKLFVVWKTAYGK